MNQPSPEPSEVPSSAGSPDDAPTHFDGLIGDAPPSAQAAGSAAPAMLTKDEFHKVFIGGFKGAHLFTKLESLHIGPERAGEAEACSNALYESILDIPSLHFMLTPGSKWWGRAMAIGMFTYPMAKGISLELRVRKAALAHQPQAAAAQPMDFAAARASTQPQAEGIAGGME